MNLSFSTDILFMNLYGNTLRIYFFLFSLIIGPSLFAFEVVESDFSQYLTGTNNRLSSRILKATESAAPIQINDIVIMLNKPLHSVRYIGIAFAHEDYRKIHLFSKQVNGVYFFLYKVSGEMASLKYRLVVDGIWGADASHSNYFNDDYGHKISQFMLDNSIISEGLAPRDLGNGYYLFRYHGVPKRRVFLNSDMGSWDPFLFRMKEIGEGLYEVKMRLTPGEHYYYFMEDGNKVLGNITLDTLVHNIQGSVNRIIVAK